MHTETYRMFGVQGHKISDDLIVVSSDDDPLARCFRDYVAKDSYLLCSGQDPGTERMTHSIHQKLRARSFSVNDDAVKC